MEFSEPSPNKVGTVLGMEPQFKREETLKVIDEQIEKMIEAKRFTRKMLIEGLKNNRFKKIVVLTGAGISVSAGIPDFRSPKVGLYDNLQ